MLLQASYFCKHNVGVSNMCVSLLCVVTLIYHNMHGKPRCHQKFAIAELWLLIRVGVFRWKNVACCNKVCYAGTRLLLDLCKHGCSLFRLCMNMAVVFSGQEWASEEELQ